MQVTLTLGFAHAKNHIFSFFIHFPKVGLVLYEDVTDYWISLLSV